MVDGSRPLGERIRQRRSEKGLSSAELARRAGISKGYLSELENGGATAPKPSAEILYRIARELATTIADLMERDVAPAPPATIPSELQKFAKDEQLPEADVQMLASIKFRGNQPRTYEDWRFLYDSIRRAVREQ